MIHSENPFVDDPEHRDPVRRFRGRLAAGVTIVTSGFGEARTGLTVSSLMVMEGDPGMTQLVVGPTTDLWSVLAETGRFVIHPCRQEHRHLAEVFAGLRPSPGGLFAGLGVEETEWGPLLPGFPTKAFCTTRERIEAGYSGVVTAVIDRVEIGPLDDPLLFFQGHYHRLD